MGRAVQLREDRVWSLLEEDGLEALESRARLQGCNRNRNLSCARGKTLGGIARSLLSSHVRVRLGCNLVAPPHQIQDQKNQDQRRSNKQAHICILAQYAPLSWQEYDAGDFQPLMEHKFETSKTFDGPTGNNYAQLTVLREREREDAIRQGFIDDPDRPKALEEARSFEGTCMDMCPRYEREQREFQNDVKRWEVNPETGRIDASLAVKAFHRPAAGNEQALPSDVRPPSVLSATLDYLVDQIVAPSDPLDKDTHGFVRDRTRSIRQDFVLQNERGIEAITCHERIVRFHILSIHLMAEVDGFDAHQEMEQLRKTLQSLSEYYDDQRAKGALHPREAEFRAYHILTRLRDPDVLRHTQTLPREVRKSREVSRALELYKYAQRSNEEIGRFKSPNTEGSQNQYSRFFRLVRNERTSYTMACLCEPQFNDIRKGALKSMRKAFISAIKPPSVDELVPLLGCDGPDEIEAQCEQYGIVVKADDGGILRPVLNKSVHFDESRPDMRQKFSRNVVEAKRGNASFAQIINGTDSNLQIRVQKIGSRSQATLGQDGFQHNGSLSFPSTVAFGSANGAVTSLGVHNLPADPQNPGAIEKRQFPVSPRPVPVFNFGSSAKTHTEDVKTTPQIRCEDAKIRHQPQSLAAGLRPVQDAVQVDRTEKIEDSHAKAILEERAAQQALKKKEMADLRAQLADELYRGLVRDQISKIVTEQYADIWRERKTRRSIWQIIRSTCENVRRRRELREERALAEQRKQQSYAEAFQELYNEQNTRSRKRRRSNRIESTLASTASITRAKDASQRFWSPLDLPHYLSAINLTERQEPWKLLIAAHQPGSSSCKWLKTKFGLEQGNTRTLVERDRTIEIEVLSESTGDQLSGIGALVFELSGATDADGDRARLLSLLQRIADESDSKFPIMILKFGKIEDKMELARSLMVPEVLSDKKSPVTGCHFVGIESMDDVVKFEKALDDTVSDTDSSLSPLAIERNEASERERRHVQDALKAEQQRRGDGLMVKLRSSFYDNTVIPLKATQVSKISRQPPQLSARGASDGGFVPAQVSQLMQSLKRSRELLDRTA